MKKKFGQSNEDVAAYVEELFKPEDTILKKTREAAQKAGLPPIQLATFDSRHLEILVRMTGAKKAVEIGTLGGYSGIAIARALGKKGVLHTFELDRHHAEVAEAAFKGAKLEAKVKVHVGPAIENLPDIEDDGPFDIVFIDADKVSYPSYLKWAAENLRVGGVAIGDNTFAWGQIHMTKGLAADQAKSVGALREFNQIAATSKRFRSTILPTAEGLTVAVKIS